jgi:hypothetical protein
MTAIALAMHRENDFAQKRAVGSRVVYFGTDGGSFELFFDVDDRFGRGRCAVLAADRSCATRLSARVRSPQGNDVTWAPALPSRRRTKVSPPGSPRRCVAKKPAATSAASSRASAEST